MVQALFSRFPASLRDRLGALPEDATELRVRIGAPVLVCAGRRAQPFPPPVTARELAQLIGSLTDQSVYAWADALNAGFFTLPDGFRVGVTGRYAGETLQNPTAVCIRIARDHPGAATPVLARMLTPQGPQSALLLAPPGLGKTTMLRDALRQLAMSGQHVAVADERGELCDAARGLCDVSAFAPKHEAIPRLIRSMAPTVLVTDELGDPRDAEAVARACRAGVAVLASAHAQGFRAALKVPALAPMLSGDSFRFVFTLGETPGRVVETLELGAPEAAQP